MISNPKRPLSPKVWQEYLEALATSQEPESARSHKLLFSFAELLYRMRGGGRCAVCSTHVRHVVPVSVERADGTQVEYSCLCVRCLAAEKATCKRVTLRIGEAVVEYTSKSKFNGDEAQPDTAKFPAKPSPPAR